MAEVLTVSVKADLALATRFSLQSLSPHGLPSPPGWHAPPLYPKFLQPGEEGGSGAASVLTLPQPLFPV